MSGKTDYFSLVRYVQDGRLNETVFLFFGPEQYLTQQGINLLTDHFLTPASKDFNLIRIDAYETDFLSFTYELYSLPIFSDYRVIVVQNSDKFFASGKNRHHHEEEAITSYLENPNEACCLIFIMTGKPDSRKKIFKKILASGHVVEFALLRESQVLHWLRGRLEQMDRQITPEALHYIIACTGNDLFVLEHELEKLALFAPSVREISLEMARQTVSKTAGAGIFDLVDAVGEKKAVPAIELLREMLAAGEAPVYILHMLARQFRLILSVKSLLSQRLTEKQIQVKLSLHPYVFKKVLQQSKNFDEQDLKRGLKHLLDADVGLKNSLAEPGYLLEMAVLKIGC